MSGTTSATLFEDLMVDWGEIDYLLTNEIAQRDLILTDLGLSAAADDNTEVPSVSGCTVLTRA
jgi:L-rhamnose isomerase